MMLVKQPSCLDRPSPPPNRDEELQALARRALDTCGYRVLSRLECYLADGAVILSGVVSSFYYKQVAQAAVRRALCSIATGGRIDNKIVVREPLTVTG